MAHGDAREGKWRGKMRKEWVASSLALYVGTRSTQLLSADPHSSAASSRLNWHPRRFKWTRPFHLNLVSARAPSRFERAVPHILRNMKLNLQYYFGVKENISKCSVKSSCAQSCLGWIINSIFSETKLIPAHIPNSTVIRGKVKW